MQNPPRERGLYGQRPSKSADAARRAEFARIAAMTPRQRMLKALELGERMKHLASEPESQVDVPHRVALKLNLGDDESMAELAEILKRHPTGVLSEIRAVCDRFGLGKALERFLADLSPEV